MDKRERLVAQFLGRFKGGEVHHFASDPQIQQIALAFPAPSQHASRADDKRIARFHLDPVFALARFELPAQRNMQDHVVIRGAEGGGLAFGFAIPAQEAQVDAADARMRFTIANEAARIGDGKRAASGGKIQDTLARGQNVRGGKMLAAVHQVGAAFDPLRNGERTGTDGRGHGAGTIDKSRANLHPGASFCAPCILIALSVWTRHGPLASITASA